MADSAAIDAPVPAQPSEMYSSSSLPMQTGDATQNQVPATAPQRTNQAAPENIPGDKGDRVHYDKNGNAIQTPPPPLDYGQQPKRIMGWIPNYRAVSVGAKPPPPTFKEKFLIGTQNTFDYSAFIFNAVDSEFPYVFKSYPEFGNGWVGYGVYFWHGFVDKGIGNYMTDTIVPTLTRQDSRYYAMGTGHWYVRAFYAYTRVLITPNDAGKNTFNYSEIVGKGAAAGLGDLYYPARYEGWTKTGQRWLVQVAIRDGGFNVFREFWPDIAKHILHLSPQNQ
ncbi:MAG: hypothetical protein ACYDC6_10690 [Acidobacteriaceae bacterium]